MWYLILIVLALGLIAGFSLGLWGFVAGLVIVTLFAVSSGIANGDSALQILAQAVILAVGLQLGYVMALIIRALLPRGARLPRPRWMNHQVPNDSHRSE